MGRRKKLRLAAVARRAFFFVAGSLLVGFLAVFLNAVLAMYMPRHFSVSIAGGVAVAFTCWVVRLATHPPLRGGSVAPGGAGLCAGLGVHIARTWIR